MTLCVATLASPAAASDGKALPGFRSPSGNIKCLFVPGSTSTMLCTVAHADYAVTLQNRCLGPGGSGVDWHGFTLGAATKGSVSCSGGILYVGRPSYVTLPYGKTWRHGVFTCWSRTAGVTCRNAKGHGLFVSRRSWRAW
jgi:hypothetical protein